MLIVAGELLTKSTDPLTTGTITRFGRVSKANQFRFDAVGSG